MGNAWLFGEFRDSSRRTLEGEGGLSAGARALIARAYAGRDSPGGEDALRPEDVVDYHVHLAGVGDGAEARAGCPCCWTHPNSRRWATAPHHRLKFRAFLAGFGVGDDALQGRASVDDTAKRTLVRLVRDLNPFPEDHGLGAGHARAVLLAFDHVHDRETGQPDRSKSVIYVPCELVASVRDEFPDTVAATCSIHPYRADALGALEAAAARGATLCKWLPNSMGIDPTDPRCVPFYARLVALGMPLLCHVGEEHSVDLGTGCLDNEMGNPLRLRAALDAGCKVIMAHCASEGRAIDLDAPVPEGNVRPPRADCFDLFTRLMDTPRYQGLLYADISSLTAWRRCGTPLRTVLERSDWHARLVHGSDYPVPAVRTVVQTAKLVKLGYITAEERRAVDEIWTFNPILFDLVLKRTLRHPSTGQGFPACIFREHASLPLALPPP